MTTAAATDQSKHPPRAARAKRVNLKRMFWILLGFLLAYYTALFFAQRWILYPGTTLGPRGLALPPHVQVIDAEHEQGKTHGLFIPGPRKAGGSPAPLVVFFHGNFELAEDNVAWMHPYIHRGFSVLIVEYRGYGSSNGTPTQQNIVDDASNLLEQIIESGDADPNQMLFHGRSLGGGVACALAQKHKPSAIVLESTFNSIKRMGRRFGALPFLVRDPYDTLGFLKSYDGPVLILHGQADQVIPVAHARRNHAAAANSTLHTFPGKNHNDPWHEDFLDALNNFLDESTLTTPSAPQDGLRTPAATVFEP